MTTVLIILAIIGVFVWHHYSMKKIDEEEAQALKTPGTATFLRSNFGGFISKVLEDTNNYIVFERTDQIRFGKRGIQGYELVCGNMMEMKGSVMYVVIQKGMQVISEWKFPKGANQDEISNIVLIKF